MSKFVSVLVAAMFAAVSVSALAASHAGGMDKKDGKMGKMEKKDGKMDKKMDKKDKKMDKKGDKK